jgi:hypothetical protein
MILSYAKISKQKCEVGINDEGYFYKTVSGYI